ncbi:hypothetical protein ACFFRR_000155 [Megaselia abdita]
MTSTTMQNGVSDGCENSAKVKYQNQPNGRLSTNNNGDDFAVDMNRKIQINGETELRIDERKISVHINNPFLSDKPSTSAEPDYAEVNKCRPKRPHSIPVSSALNDLQTPPPSVSSSSSVVQSLYNQYRNSPQRLSLLQPNDQASLYLPPSPLASTVNENNNILPQLPPKNLSLQQPVVPRRSQSTPRPNHPPISGTNRDGSPSTIIVNGQIVSQRPRSLDRCASVEKTNGTYNPPPIPLRRLSQPGGIPLNNSTTGFNTIRNKNNIVVTPTTSVITKQHHQQQPISRGNLPGSNVSTNGGGGATSSMRHSITFHGPLNRQSSIGGAGQQQSFQQQKTSSIDNGNATADHSSAGTLPGKRNDKRPMSYAYGSVPDQAYLENQLRIYSEQLRSITESVRKYSEQAKLLSELKRQHNQQSPMNVVHKPIPMSQSAGNFQASILSPDPRTSSSSSLPTDAQTPSHQLRMFLENIRSSMRTPDTPVGNVLPPSIPQPITTEDDHKPVKVPFKPISPAPLTTNNEPKAKTPSDQLRMFLDAIRSNQEPEPLAKSPNLLMTSSKELTLTKQRPKSTSNESFGHSMSTSESFHQISDNLRIMSQDLEALSPSRNTVSSKTQPLNIQTDQTADFYQILDNFHKMADHYKAIGSIEYLKKCSEALMQSTEFLKQQQRLQLQNNGFGTDTDSSSCSTTPGSIREAVQNLLMQPRNGFQIMDDRLSLFIDIMDSQEKFSQTTKATGQPSLSTKNPITKRVKPEIKFSCHKAEMECLVCFLLSIKTIRERTGENQLKEETVAIWEFNSKKKNISKKETQFPFLPIENSYIKNFYYPLNTKNGNCSVSPFAMYHQLTFIDSMFPFSFPGSDSNLLFLLYFALPCKFNDALIILFLNFSRSYQLENEVTAYKCSGLSGSIYGRYLLSMEKEECT